MADVSLPLDGITVIDLSTSYAGPTATRYLAEMGADVVKVEPIRGDDARQWGPPFVGEDSAWFLSTNARKRSVALDIRTEEGQQVLHRLLATADVLVENFSPGKLERLGLDPQTVVARHPKLVYCAISGFGLTGPAKDRPGYDLIAQARSGMMSVTGSRPDDPQRVGTALSDVATGIVAAFTVAAALVRQQATGQGEVVDVSLLGTDLALMNPRISSFLAGEPEPRACNGEDSVIAIYQRFDTADRPLVVAVGNDRAWTRFCDVIDRADLLGRPELADNAGRRKHRAEIISIVRTVFLERTAAEWAVRLEAAHIPFSEILTVSEAVEDEHVVATRHLVAGTTADGTEFRSVRPPWSLQGTPPGGTAPTAPRLGQHTAEVLRDLGLDDDDVRDLSVRGVITKGARSA